MPISTLSISTTERDLRSLSRTVTSLHHKGF
jgi:hypothetical protein